MVYARRRGYRRRTTRRYRPRTTGIKRKSGWWKRRTYRHKSKWQLFAPRTKLIKLKYVEHYVQAAGATTRIVQTWRGNGVYDPEYSIGGGTCSGFSTWAAQYQFYKVVAAKCKLRVTNTTDNLNLLCVLDARDENQGTPASNADVRGRKEMPSQVNRTTEVWRNGANTKPVYLQMFKKTKDIIPDAKMDNADISSLVTGVPSNEWFFDFYCCQGSASSLDASQISCDYDIQITYYVKFSGPNNIADIVN